LKFQDYIDFLPSNISPVKLLILNKLWHTDTHDFPKPWVSSADLLDLTGQKYFDRRARELRDQTGCDLETKHVADLGGHAWRIKSPNLATPQDREYLSQSQKKNLFSTFNNACAICGKVADAGVRGLQADHRVPISRGGTNDISNWQAVCNHCNVGKRRACEGCTIDCLTCSWAYPDKVGISIIISMKEHILKNVTELSQRKNQTISETLEEAALLYIKQDHSL